MRKLLFYTNALLFFTVMACYIVNDVDGQLAEVYFGVFQLIAAVALTSYTLFNKEKTIKKHLHIYWILVAVFIFIFKTAFSASHNITTRCLYLYILCL